MFPMSQEEEGKWKGSFFFVQMADTQFGFWDYENGGLVWEKEIETTTKAVEHINRLRPRFVVVCGDLINNYPPPVKQQGPNILDSSVFEAQVADFKRIMGKIDKDIPLVCVCGNHDVGNTPTKESIQYYKDRFGDDYFSFWVGGVLCIVLNSNLYYDPSESQAEYEQQHLWLQQLLTQHSVRLGKGDDNNNNSNNSNNSDSTKPSHILIFQHHPWFLREISEPDDYFCIPGIRRVPTVQLLSQHGVTAVFTGHYHRNALANFDKVQMITTSAIGRPLGSDPSGFRVVHVHKDRIEHKYYDVCDVPDHV